MTPEPIAPHVTTIVNPIDSKDDPSYSIKAVYINTNRRTVATI